MQLRAGSSLRLKNGYAQDDKIATAKDPHTFGSRPGFTMLTCES
jgi:hypothetical protein